MENPLIVAVFPGIFEEIMFRGFMIRFFEGTAKRWQ
jgi:membrane protease YdiL (CAAX protease family)